MADDARWDTGAGCALVLSRVATFLVARVAWPLDQRREAAVTGEAAELERE
jgi:hypothetical protein